MQACSNWLTLKMSWKTLWAICRRTSVAEVCQWLCQFHQPLEWKNKYLYHTVTNLINFRLFCVIVIIFTTFPLLPNHRPEKKIGLVIHFQSLSPYFLLFPIISLSSTVEACCANQHRGTTSGCYRRTVWTWEPRLSTGTLMFALTRFHFHSLTDQSVFPQH